MNDFSVSMALVDYIPVACFAAAAVILLYKNGLADLKLRGETV